MRAETCSSRRLKAWHDVPLASRMSFSSYSRTVDDIWGHDIPRDFRIVAYPGYEPPGDLDRDHPDSMWVPAEVPIDGPTVLWDGWDETALFEIIYECMNYDGPGRSIGVETASGEPVSDDRDPEIMRLRPRRASGMCRNATWNRYVELSIWASMFPSSDHTAGLYHEIIDPAGEELADTMDSSVRRGEFIACGLKLEKLQGIQADLLKREADGRLSMNVTPCVTGGPGHPVSQAKVRNDLSARSRVGGVTLHPDDFPDGPPESYRAFREARAARS